MKVLFVSSGNRKNGLNPIIKLQAKSLEENGVQIEYFLIFGNGIRGYISNFFKLRSHLNKQSYDLIHAHFGFSCVIAHLAKGKLPLLVTLMGTDILGHKNNDGKMRLGHKMSMWINRFFANYIYKVVIVKSIKMKQVLWRKATTYIIPNGVDTALFDEVPRNQALEFLGWDKKVNHIIFLSNPSRPEKNYKLAKRTISDLKAKGFQVELHPVFQEKSENLKYYYSAATALVLTSFHEGSPNVIKEALACNCPIVSTDVGDVAINIANLEGCFLAPFDAEGFSREVVKVIEFGNTIGRTKGRERINDLDFDKKIIAEKIIHIYENMMSRVIKKD